MGGSTPNGDTLKQYRTLLLKIVERIEDDIKDVKTEVGHVRAELVAVRTDDIPAIKIEIAEIKTENRVKSTVYGLLGGFIPAAGLFFYWLNTQ